MSQFSPTGELNADGLYVILKLISFAAEENQSMFYFVALFLWMQKYRTLQEEYTT